jgi:hypothetical protein
MPAKKRRGLIEIELWLRRSRPTASLRLMPAIAAPWLILKLVDNQEESFRKVI